jgi:phosphocarrier protein
MTGPEAEPGAGDAPAAKRLATIVNQRGLHARAAARFVAVAEEFEAEITVSARGHSVSGRSIMGLMMLAASLGTEIEIAATGAAAEAAAKRLAVLVEAGFEED